jgi:hypothetical protein
MLRVSKKIALPNANLITAYKRNFLTAILALAGIAPRLGCLTLIIHKTGVTASE